MLTISKQHTVFALSPNDPPAARADSGDTVRFETLDCFGEQITNENQQLGGIDWARINPATGPLYVSGALPGDTLKVEILSIELAPQAAVVEAPEEGITGLEAKAEVTKILPIRDGKAIFNARLALPLSPMIGVIGTAPAGDAVPTGTPALHGGNMDCRRIGAGTTLYLPVNVEGALLAMGDLHALMGDGEVCVCGAEISGAVTVRVTVLKDAALPLPFLKTETDAMAIYSDESLDAAAAGATLRMRRFLIEQVGMVESDAGMLLSLMGDLRICQAVDPNKTCRMELPCSLLEPYGYRFP